MLRLGSPWIAAGLLGAVWIAPAAAAAQNEAETAMARTLFQQGVEAADAERWDEAADLLRRSRSLRPSPVVSFNLAGAEAHRGRLVVAAELLREVARSQSAEDDLRAAASRQLAEIEPQIGRGRIVLEGDPEGVTVTVDGDPWPEAAIGVATAIDPGTHAVAATRDGVTVADRQLVVPSGGEASLTLQIPARPPTPRETAERDPGTERDRPPGPRPIDDGGGAGLWIGIGIGGVVLAAAVVVLILVLGGAETGPPATGNLDPGLLEVGR